MHHFNLARHSAVPAHKTIMNLVQQVEVSGSVVDIKHGLPKATTTPENVARVKEAFMCSPHCSAHKHSQTLQISRRSVECILSELKFHPYKNNSQTFPFRTTSKS